MWKYSRWKPFDTRLQGEGLDRGVVGVPKRVHAVISEDVLIDLVERHHLGELIFPPIVEALHLARALAVDATGVHVQGPVAVARDLQLEGPQVGEVHDAEVRLAGRDGLVRGLEAAHVGHVARELQLRAVVPRGAHDTVGVAHGVLRLRHDHARVSPAAILHVRLGVALAEPFSREEIVGVDHLGGATAPRAAALGDALAVDGEVPVGRRHARVHGPQGRLEAQGESEVVRDEARTLVPVVAHHVARGALRVHAHEGVHARVLAAVGFAAVIRGNLPQRRRRVQKVLAVFEGHLSKFTFNIQTKNLSRVGRLDGSGGSIDLGERHRVGTGLRQRKDGLRAVSHLVDTFDYPSQALVPGHRRARGFEGGLAVRLDHRLVINPRVHSTVFGLPVLSFDRKVHRLRAADLHSRGRSPRFRHRVLRLALCREVGNRGHGSYAGEDQDEAIRHGRSPALRFFAVLMVVR
jgi:hypothetical protein